MEADNDRQGVPTAEDSTRGIKEALTAALKAFGSDGEPLILAVEQTNNRQKLFLMWQILREEYLRSIKGTVIAPIQIKLPNGNLMVAKNYDDAIRIFQKGG